MPKIAADTVAEHVAQQEAAVVSAAARLFAERGVGDVSLADIAAEVGLARNSLYRYFPDKAHILAAWFRVTVAPLIETSDEIAARPMPSAARVASWVDAQFDYLTAPEHAAMLAATGQLGTLPDDVAAEIGARHRELYGSLASILGEAFADHTDRDVPVVTMLLAALVRSAAEQANAGADRDAVRAELQRVVTALLA